MEKLGAMMIDKTDPVKSFYNTVLTVPTPADRSTNPSLEDSLLSVREGVLGPAPDPTNVVNPKSPIWPNVMMN